MPMLDVGFRIMFQATRVPKDEDPVPLTLLLGKSGYGTRINDETRVSSVDFREFRYVSV